MKAHIVLLQLLLIFPNFFRIVNAHWYGKSQRLLNRSYAERRRSLPHGLRESEPKGECVIVISPCDNNIAADNTKLRETVSILLNAGIGAKNMAKIASSILNVPKNEAYRLALELSDE